MTSEIEDLLANGEEIQRRANPSIMDSSFVKSYTISAFMIVGIFALALAPLGLGFDQFYFLGLFVIPLAIIGRSEFQRRFIRYYITSQQVIERRGVLSQTTESTMYENITDVKMNKDINERIFDVGDLKINTAGHDGATIRLRGLKDPENYKKVIEDNINRAEGNSTNQNFGGNNGGFEDNSGGGLDGGLDDSSLGDADFGDDLNI